MPRSELDDDDETERTDSLMRVAEALNVNILTGKSLATGGLTEMPRLKGNYAPDPVSAIFNLYKSVNNDKRSPNWAGAAFNTTNLQHIQTNLDYLMLPQMSETYLRPWWNTRKLKTFFYDSMDKKKEMKDDFQPTRIVSGRFDKEKR